MEVRYLEGFGIVCRVFVYQWVIASWAVLTLSKSPDTLPVHASTVFIRIAEQEPVEMFLDGAADTLSRNPLGNGIRFDVTEVFERYFLRKVKR